MTRNCRSHATRSHDLMSKHSNHCGLGLDVSAHGESTIGNLSKDYPIRDPSWTEGSTTLIDDETTSSPSVYETRTPAFTHFDFGARESTYHPYDAGPTVTGDVEPDQLSASRYENTDYEGDEGHPLPGAVQLSLSFRSPAQGIATLRYEGSDSDCPSSHQTSSD